jgi:hypothetical protein
MMIESRLEVLRRRVREELTVRRVNKLAARNWCEYIAHEDAPENAARCEAAKQIHGAHAVVLLRLMRDYQAKGHGNNAATGVVATNDVLHLSAIH